MIAELLNLDLKPNVEVFVDSRFVLEPVVLPVGLIFAIMGLSLEPSVELVSRFELYFGSNSVKMAVGPLFFVLKYVAERLKN